jgi:membrane protein
MLAYFGARIDWKTLVKRTLRESIRDDADGLAAQLGYYFFLSLFPMLLFLIALASLFPLQHLTDETVRMLQPIAPAEVITIIKDQMLAIANSRSTALLSLGLIGAIWSSSAAMGAIVSAMNRAYGVQDSRPWWKVKLLAVLLTVGLAFFILISLTLVVAGPQLADWFARMFGWSQFFVWTWKVLQWPLVFLLVATAIGLIYYFAPDAEQDWVWITPGSVLATSLWLLGSLGFRLYVVNFGNYEAGYGTIGGIIVLLLWFYLSGFVIIVGAELNSEIEHASPWGKHEGEKVPGEKRLIGPAAARAYHERGTHGPKAARLPR